MSCLPARFWHSLLGVSFQRTSQGDPQIEVCEDHIVR